MKRWQKERQAAKEHTYGQKLEQIKPVCNQRCRFIECLVEVKLKSLRIIFLVLQLLKFA